MGGWIRALVQVLLPTSHRSGVPSPRPSHPHLTLAKKELKLSLRLLPAVWLLPCPPNEYGSKEVVAVRALGGRSAPQLCILEARATPT